MELSEVFEKCLGHGGTLGLLESWREILAERQVRDDDEINNNIITVSVGPSVSGRYIQDSHWSSSYNAALSLVESCRVLKYFHSVAGASSLMP